MRNIKIALVVSAFAHLFFWFGPWILYLLEYLTISQVAIIEMIGLVTGVLFEVPTGAIADLIGKKRTLLLSFLLTATGEFIMVIRPSFETFALAYFVLNLGYSLYSGTMDAFLYDTLVSKNEESKYQKVLSRYSAATSSATAIASLIGGFMYSMWMWLPFVATGIAKLVSFVLTLFLKEPEVDTEKFSLKNFLVQTKKGFSHLFDRKMMQLSILLISFGAFFTVNFELLDDVAVVDFGYEAVGIGILYAVVTILTVPSALLYEKLASRYKPFALIGFSAFLLFLNYIFSPWVNIYMWTGLFMARVIYSPIRTSAITEAINVRTPSSIRATTISTYELLRRIPFVLLAGQIGMMMETIGVKMFSFWFAVLIAIIVGPQLVLFLMQGRKERIETFVPIP